MLTDSKRIKELDFLRGIAAISVALFHFSFAFNRKDNNSFLHYGFLGVELFFVISGFVIFMSISSGKSWKSFLWSRFARLYPAYWFSVMLSFILFSIPSIFAHQTQMSFKVNEISFFRFLVNLTMFQRFVSVDDIDGAYWTLAIELGFYLVIAFLLWRDYLYHILLISFIIIASIFIDKAIYSFIPLYFFKYGLYFVSGIMFYQIYSKSYVNRSWVHFIIVSSLLINVLFIYQEFFQKIIIVVIYLVFYSLAYGKLDHLRFQPILFMGKISYSFYLLHENIGSLIFNIADLLAIKSLAIKIVLAFCVLVPLSYFSFALFEMKISKFLARLKLGRV